MAYYDPFSFASDSELMPIYYDDELANFGTEFDLFSDPIMDFNPSVPAVNQSNVDYSVNPVASNNYGDFNYSNPPYMPYSENQWEQPLPYHQTFLKPDANQMVAGGAPMMDVMQHQRTASIDQDDELDFALALNPEPNPPQMSHPYTYYAPQQQQQQASVYHQPMAYGQPQSPLKATKRHRVVEDEDDFDLSAVETEPMDFGEEDDPTGGFKLPASKSPIMEAMVVCALKRLGYRNCY